MDTGVHLEITCTMVSGSLFVALFHGYMRSAGRGTHMPDGGLARPMVGDYILATLAFHAGAPCVRNARVSSQPVPR